MQIELSYINTNHPDFTDGASLVSSIAMNHEMVCIEALVIIIREKLEIDIIEAMLSFSTALIVKARRDVISRISSQCL